MPHEPLSGLSLSQAALWLWPVVLAHSVAEWPLPWGQEVRMEGEGDR